MTVTPRPRLEAALEYASALKQALEEARAAKRQRLRKVRARRHEQEQAALKIWRELIGPASADEAPAILAALRQEGLI